MVRFTGSTTKTLLTSVVLALIPFTQPALAEQPATTLVTLLDKAQIEDLLVEYYNGLGQGREDFGHYYLEDGVLDVNGIIGQGRKGIEDLYRKIGAASPNPPGTFHMLL